MKNRGMRIRNGKKRGEWAELCFAVRAIEEGLRLSRPWGESSGYDFAVEYKEQFARVQVKSTMFREGGGYSCSMKDSRGPYRRNKFDFAAAYVIPENVWYIIPAKKLRGKWSIHLNPKLEDAKYVAYKEAWWLLRGDKPEPGWVDRIQACAEVWEEAGASSSGSGQERLLLCRNFGGALGFAPDIDDGDGPERNQVNAGDELG